MYDIHSACLYVHCTCMHAQTYLCVAMARDQIYNLPETHQLEGHVVI